MSKNQLNSISELIENEITKCTLQLYQIVEGKFISQGSAVLITVEQQYWLLTASHVSKCHSKGNELFFQHRANEFFSIAGFFGETPITDNSQLDFAIIKLEQKCVDKLKEIKTFLNSSYTCLLQNQFEKQLMIICGFPSVATDTSTSEIASVGHYYFTNTSNKKPYEYYGFSDEQFIIVEYAGKGFDLITNKKKKTKEPYGMSGGGLWKIWQDEGDKNFKFCLTGILTETRNGKYYVIIANKINLLLDLIYEYISSHNNG